MTLLAAVNLNPVGQIAVAALLGTAGLFFLLPRPRGRSVAAGVFLSLAAAVVTGVFLLGAFGRAGTDVVAGALFWLFTAGALGFGVVLVAQRNPARGAIAFAFVILSTCGLFLLLAAPFLMAATLIIYAGAIIVTFLFVLMLSRTEGPSDENDRSREPLLGSLAGFAFTGLVLFALYLTAPPATAGANDLNPLPTAPLTDGERGLLLAVSEELRAAEAAEAGKDLDTHVQAARVKIEQLDRAFAIPTPEARHLAATLKPTFERLDNNLLGANPDLGVAKADVRLVREDLDRLHRSRGGLSARNVSSVGHALYSEHLLAVEMAGTLLLIATIGAVTIAQRKRAQS